MMKDLQDTELLERFSTSRDPSLREALILRYVPLVHFVLGRLGLSQEIGVEYEDLISQGLLGLIKAVDRYDPSHQTKFSTYASTRIRGHILDHLRSMDWLSRSARKRVREIQEAIKELWETLHREPTEEELAEHLSLDLKQLRKALQDSSVVIVSLDTEMDLVGEHEASLHELIEDQSLEKPLETLVENELKMRLEDALMELTEREQLLLSLYYYEGLTMKEIGMVLDLSESRVCQLHAKAIMLLKAALGLAMDGNGHQDASDTPLPTYDRYLDAPHLVSAENSSIIPFELDRGEA
jgi:RNA polymerase sigma factor for flagellar operon FliA